MISIEHIAMYVEDLEGAKEFFIKFFEAKSSTLYHNQKTGFKSYFLEFLGNCGARLEIMHKDNLDNLPKTINRTGFVHLAFSVGSKEKVDLLTEKLRNAGYEVISGPRTTGDGYYESAIIAIENNLIELTL
ncbi:MAG: VOC family protein [Succinivibrionaceae bacterium]